VRGSTKQRRGVPGDRSAERVLISASTGRITSPLCAWLLEKFYFRRAIWVIGLSRHVRTLGVTSLRRHFSEAHVSWA